MTTLHDCVYHLRLTETTNTEPHGETHTDDWFECRICGQKFDPVDADVERVDRVRMQEQADRWLPYLDAVAERKALAFTREESLCLAA